MQKTIYIVVPCYNEEEVLQNSAELLKNKLNELIGSKLIKSNSKIMFVNDGSKDNTWKIIHELCRENNIFSGLNLSRNYGHQSAILAGMMTSKEMADAVITIDADLQQDIGALEQFIHSFYNGNEIVYGVRNNRETDGVFKKATAMSYYNLLHFLGCNVITNHADYRLMSKKALNALAEFKESNLFMRGLIPMIGFQSDTVYFDVKKREAGKSKYTLKKMLTLAIDGITSLSIKPIHFISMLGLLVCLFSIGMGVFSLIDWARGNTVPGYTTSVLTSLLMGGVTLLSLGIIGEYIGKIYIETKERPRYIIESFVFSEGTEQQEKEERI